MAVLRVSVLMLAACNCFGQGSLSAPFHMNEPRAAHTATLLSDGRVLLAGGFRPEGTREVAIASAEIYQPATSTFLRAGALNEPRDGHTATLLPNGDVLIVGGWGLRDRLASAEIFDRASGEFHRIGGLAGPRQGMTATLLLDGRVLIAGGDSTRGVPSMAAEIYNPATGSFAAAGRLRTGRAGHTATLLADGRVLLAGGVAPGGAVLSSAEIYDPATGTFTLTGSLGAERYKHAAALLPDGGIMLLGGSNQSDWTGMYASTEVYDTIAGIFRPGPALSKARFKLPDAAVRLNDGAVFVGGGNRLIEIFDPRTRGFLRGPDLDDDYFSAVATMLRDGTVLVTGGYTSRIQPTDKAWLYRPAAGSRGDTTAAWPQAPSPSIHVRAITSLSSPIPQRLLARRTTPSSAPRSDHLAPMSRLRRSASDGMGAAPGKSHR